MAESEQVIHLTGQEDVHAVRTLLARAQAQRLLLVVPKGHPTFQRLVRLKLIARQATAEGRRLALVSPDAAIRERARELDLSAFRTVEAGRKARHWRSGAGTYEPGPRAPVALGRGRSAVLARNRAIGSRSNWGENVMLAGLIFGVMIMMSAALLLLVPSAQVTLVPRQSPLELTLPVTIDTNAQEADFENSILPGALLIESVEGSQETPASGRRDVPAAAARGQVTFVNVTGVAVNIPVGTVVSTSSGASVRFRTTEEVRLPGQLNVQGSAPIEAILPGLSGNVGPLQINLVEGAAATVVRAFNEGPIEGGSVEQRPVVTQADKDQLLEQLRQRLLQEGQTMLEQSLEKGGDNFLVPGTLGIEITAETYSGSVDAAVETLRLDLRARVSSVVVSRRAVNGIALRALRAEVPEGFALLDEGQEVTAGEATISEQGLPVMAVRASGIAGAQISEVDVRTLVRGQPIEEARALLIQRQPLAADPAIEMSPSWWQRMPYLPIRIFVRLGLLGSSRAPDGVPLP